MYFSFINLGIKKQCEEFRKSARENDRFGKGEI